MYKEIIERNRRKKLLLDRNNWKWDISSSNQPAYYIDSHGLEDAEAQSLVREYIGDEAEVLISCETDHHDASKRLVVVRFMTAKDERNVLWRLIGKTTPDLYIAWLTRTIATDTSKWDAAPDVPNAIECIITSGCLDQHWKLKAVKSQKEKVLGFLRDKMGVPASGRLYLDYRYGHPHHLGNPHLIWHSCPRCDQPLSIMERLFGNWWGRHISDEWGL